jgi:predicted ATPase
MYLDGPGPLLLMIGLITTAKTLRGEKQNDAPKNQLDISGHLLRRGNVVIKSLRLNLDSNCSDMDRIRRASPVVSDLLVRELCFSPLTIIVGENGTGKSLLFILLALALQIRYAEAQKSSVAERLYRVSGDRGLDGLQEHLKLKFDKGTHVVYHSGLIDTTDHNRLFSSSGEGSLYDLLSCTSDIQKYIPETEKSYRIGSEMTEHYTSVTKRFVSGRLDLQLRKDCTLLTDEPEASLSRGRMKALMDYLSRWMSQGNQIIMATNHPWLIEEWASTHKAQIVNLDL